MVGEGEGEPFQRQTREVYRLLPGPKELRAFPDVTGADAHSQVNNLPLAQEVVFDWLEDVLSPATAQPHRGDAVPVGS